MVPKSYNKVPLNKLGSIREIANSSLDTIDKDTKILSLLSGKPVSYYEAMGFDTLQLFRDRIKFLFSQKHYRVKKYIWVKFRRFKAITSTHEVSSSTYLGLKACMKRGDINGDNLHSALSQVYRRCPVFRKMPKEYSIQEQEETAQWLLNHAMVGQVNGALFFYSDVYKRSNKIMAIYLESQTRTMALEVMKGELEAAMPA